MAVFTLATDMVFTSYTNPVKQVVGMRGGRNTGSISGLII